MQEVARMPVNNSHLHKAVTGWSVAIRNAPTPLFVGACPTELTALKGCVGVGGRQGRDIKPEHAIADDATLNRRPAGRGCSQADHEVNSSETVFSLPHRVVKQGQSNFYKHNCM